MMKSKPTVNIIKSLIYLGLAYLLHVIQCMAHRWDVNTSYE